MHTKPLPLVELSTLSATHMRLRDVLLFQPDSLHETTLLVLPWHEPPFLAPSETDVYMDTPRDQRTPGEVDTYVKRRYCPKSLQGKIARELRWVTTCLSSDPTEKSTP